MEKCGIFSGNPRGLLLATDVAARGLDIPDVQHVIHYQVPKTTEVRHFRWQFTLPNKHVKSHRFAACSIIPL